jgi:hypothetical protein
MMSIKPIMNRPSLHILITYNLNCDIQLEEIIVLSESIDQTIGNANTLEGHVCGNLEGLLTSMLWANKVRC